MERNDPQQPHEDLLSRGTAAGREDAGESVQERERGENRDSQRTISLFTIVSPLVQNMRWNVPDASWNGKYLVSRRGTRGRWTNSSDLTGRESFSKTTGGATTQPLKTLGGE